MPNAIAQNKPIDPNDNRGVPYLKAKRIAITIVTENQTCVCANYFGDEADERGYDHKGDEFNISLLMPIN
jgi:hypothetical protein